VHCAKHTGLELPTGSGLGINGQNPGFLPNEAVFEHLSHFILL
jgi:hypothetical protein